MLPYPFDFVYTHAIVYRVPNSLRENSYRHKDVRNHLNIDLANQQHNEYILTLRKLNLDVIELQSDDTLPDSTFIDCVSVICDGTALISQSHLMSRRREAEITKSLLRKEGLNIVEVRDPSATLDCTDVFFTGREFFVALSKRTNIIGAKAVASAFPDYPVSLIKLKKGAVHLKAYISVAGPDLLAIGSSETAKDIIKQMKEISEYKKYQVITIPDNNAVNCIYLNNTLLHCSTEEYPASAKVFAGKIDHNRIELKNREFQKVDRFLSCRSLLFTKRKLYSILNSGYFNNIAILINQLQNEDANQEANEYNQTNNTNRAIVNPNDKRYKSVQI